MFVVEGIRAVEELARSNLQVVGALASPELIANERSGPLRQALTARSVEIAEVTSAEFRSAAETESPQGILAIAQTPDRSLNQFLDADPARILVLDAVQDPGNVGTLLRTAAGLGVTATIALPGTVDLWNAKVVRSAMGAHFVHPAFHSTWDGLQRFLEQSGIPLWGADMHGVPAMRSAAPTRLAIAVGNEGSGLSAEMRGAVRQLVALPLASGVESLNVAVAAGILLYELRP